MGKQFITTLFVPERQVLKNAVLVEYLKSGNWTIDFVAATIIDKQNHGEKLLNVFIPTPLNPTSGAMVVVKTSQTRDSGSSTDDALKAIIFGGTIGAVEIRYTTHR